MSVLVKIEAAVSLDRLVNVLRLLTESAVRLLDVYPLEIADLADELQDFAERTAALGQDFIQRVISAPFARLWAEDGAPC